MVTDHTSCGEVDATVWPDTNSTINITSKKVKKENAFIVMVSKAHKDGH